MVKKRLVLIFVLIFTLPALACSLFQPAGQDATATFIAGEIYATWTAEAFTATYTATMIPTLTPTESSTSIPIIIDTPAPTDTPKPTEPTGPTIGPLTFATGIDPNDRTLINPSTKFPTGTTEIYACHEFWEMSADIRFSEYWYRDGSEFISDTFSWDLGESGARCGSLRWTEGPKGYPPGNWEVKLYIDNELAQSGTFIIGD
jgi:hypothetical protein